MAGKESDLPSRKERKLSKAGWTSTDRLVTPIGLQSVPPRT